MTRPRPAYVRIVPIAGCVVHETESGEPMAGVVIARDANLPRYFSPRAWSLLAIGLFGTALAQRSRP